MKKTLLSFSLILGGLTTLFAQQEPISIENWCHTGHKMNELRANPQIAQEFANDALIRQQEAENGVPVPKGTVYTIPVVFHILHNGGDENVSEEQIYNALDVINRDFRLMNADTADIVTQFKPLLRDVEIQFALATIAPDGTCFPGYTRTQSALAFDGSSGTDQKNAVKNNNNVYQGNWPSDEYLNVFVVADAGGAGGYTMKPSNWGNELDMGRGIFIMYTQFGEIEESSLTAGRSLTHELGHWFNLSHTWGDSNNPGCDGTSTNPADPCYQANNCNDDDGINDTPDCIGGTGGCNLNDNGCGPIANAQNYMDYYLSCQSMFTTEQVDEMRDAVISSVGGRSNLWTSQNLGATGAGQMQLCKAEFEANRTSICAGDQVEFSDLSFNSVSGWTWTFTGGLPVNSTDENPIITYATPGLYAVTLVASDGANTETETKTSYIRVLPAASSIPLFDGFESYVTLSNIEEWEIKNDGGNGFQLATVGLNSSQSARLLNNGQTTGNVDELISAPVDLSGITGSMTLSFRYAHKRKNSSDDDWLRVYVTDDCGDNWAIRKTVHGIQLSTAVQSTSFTPSSESDWTTVHMTNVTSQFWVDKFRYKFNFEAGGGNNFFLDNINIYEGSPSDDIVVGLDDIGELEGLSVYPNPVDDELSVRFNVNAADEALVSVQDVSGKIVQSTLVHANEGTNVVYMGTQKLASGMYFLRVNIGSSQRTIQFVVK
ncbi:MAG: M43 family zinc metalloprotease [Crocinitomicaceae bacterium]|nr:M43 family zinc metalloprotease [Crocinitomicaceae bacterium]